MEKKYGKFDILVNNAAIGKRNSADAFVAKSWILLNVFEAFKGSDPTPFKDQGDPTLKTNFWVLNGSQDSRERHSEHM